MKAYQVTLQIIDFDGLGANGIQDEIENTKYSNHCINPSVSKIISMDIGEWHDEHPLNKRGSEKLFRDKIETQGEVEYTK